MEHESSTFDSIPRLLGGRRCRVRGGVASVQGAPRKPARPRRLAVASEAGAAPESPKEASLRTTMGRCKKVLVYHMSYSLNSLKGVM